MQKGTTVLEQALFLSCAEVRFEALPSTGISLISAWPPVVHTHNPMASDNLCKLDLLEEGALSSQFVISVGRT